MPNTPHPTTDPTAVDPVYLHSRRETIVIIFLFIGFLAWSITACYSLGYQLPTETEPLSTTWGMPTWVFWGIFIPCIAVDIVAVWFCFFFMKDDDLGEGEAEQTSVAQESDHA